MTNKKEKNGTCGQKLINQQLKNKLRGFIFFLSIPSNPKNFDDFLQLIHQMMADYIGP